MLKVLVVGGIRPDFISLSVLLDELKRQKLETVFVNTGQHYSFNLAKVFFEELGLDEPDYTLDMPTGLGQGKQTGFVMSNIEAILLKENPDIVISFSDANPSTFAIVAAKMGFKVAHLEAGMRSGDRRMPEEINRRAVDAISDMHFCPTPGARSNLLDENVFSEKIFVSGKLIVDVLEKYKDKIKEKEKELNYKPKSYIFSTIHRPENTESRENLENILIALNLAAEKYKKIVLACFHPRTIAAMEKFKIKIGNQITVFEPVGMFEFVALEKNAFCYVGDSGTCQEETTIFGVPCIITRPSTERPETVEIGTSVIAGYRDGTINGGNILMEIDHSLNKVRDGNYQNPYISGAAERIVDTLNYQQDWIKKKKVMWND